MESLKLQKTGTKLLPNSVKMKVLTYNEAGAEKSTSTSNYEIGKVNLSK